MAKAKENHQDIINEVLANWAEIVLNALENKIRQQKLVLSGELLRSLQHKVIQAAGESVARMELRFDEAGRMKDMRQVKWLKQPPIEVMEEFVRKVGLSSFRYIPGYEKSGKIPSENIAVRRIAWGIALSKKRGLVKHKQKQWYNKTFYKHIDRLISDLSKGYAEQTAQSIIDSIAA